jgi:hypothetical protein
MQDLPPTKILITASVSPYISQDLGVDLSVGRLDPGRKGDLLVWRAGLRERLLEGENLLSQKM